MATDTTQLPVVLVTPTFHPEQIGTPHYATELARELAAIDRLKMVVTNDPYYPLFERFEGYGRTRRHDDFEGTPVERMATIVPRRGSRLLRVLSELNFVVQLLMARFTGRVQRAEHVVVISPGVPFAVLAARVIAGRRGQVTCWVHDIAFGLAAAAASSGIGSRFGEVVRRVEAWCLAQADDIACLTKQMAAVVGAMPGVPTPEVVGLWPTIDPPPAVENEPGPVLMYSGNLGRKQGAHILLDVAEALSDREHVRLVVRGSGPGRENLEEAARRRGVHERIEFEDLVPIEQLPSALREGTVHLVTQSTDVAPYVLPSRILNVLAVGRPVVVAADEGGAIDDLAAATTAVVRVPAGDGVGLAKAALALTDEPDGGTSSGEDGRRWLTSQSSAEMAAHALLRTPAHHY